MALFEHWQTQRRKDERAVLEHIRRNGYITHESLGDVAASWYGVGDRPHDPCMKFGRKFDGWKPNDYERIIEAAKIRRRGPPKPKHEPMF
jgi:hypothetical protein